MQKSIGNPSATDSMQLMPLKNGFPKRVTNGAIDVSNAIALKVDANVKIYNGATATGDYFELPLGDTLDVSSIDVLYIEGTCGYLLV